ncbi:tyrosine-type recombinase/integrase [Nitrobacter sp.]|uniref:tyrosine-type recombinase/integrase n=1 Tax=Nitrobacter sp. TaxID=29420 RepID=UPI003F650954
MASWWIDLTENAVAALQSPPTSSTSPVDPQEIGEAVYRQLLADDEAERIEGDDRRYMHDPRGRDNDWPDLVPVRPSPAVGMELDHAEVYGSEVADLAREYRAAYARRDPTIVSAETAIELKRRGTSYDKSSPEFQAVALEVLRAHVRAYDDMEKRQRGEDVPTSSPAIAASRGPLLSEAFKVWKSGGGKARGARKPGANTIIEAEHVVRYFKELHGDMHLADITRGKAREFRDAIAKVPTRLPAKLRKLPLPKLLERDLSGLPLRHATTINKMLQVLGAIVSRAAKAGLLDDVSSTFANPFGKDIKFEVDEAARTSRGWFTKTDLAAIFTSPVYAENWRTDGGGGEAAFWFPLIALFAGMRLNEIAQLRICDLRQDEDDGNVWFFDIDRSGGRSTKTKSSVRRVPVHPELVRIGLLKYRSWIVARAANPENALWPDVRSTGDRTRSAAWSKWINRYMRDECGIADDSKVFHSFRHTFKRMTRDAGISEEMHDALTGHANRGSVGRGYGAGFSIKPLADAVARLSAPIDHLSGVTWRQPKA